MSELLTIDQTATWLKERDDFLVLTHRRPDGDTLGSGGALAQCLRELGKTAYVLCNPGATPRYIHCIEPYIAPDDFEPEHIISVDTATVDLFPPNAAEYLNRISLSIDHHPSNTFYAEHTCLNAKHASCGEVVFDIIMKMTNHISPETAERLYIALSTDTGCFSFNNTTANTLSVASQLIEAGAPSKKLNKVLFRTKTRSRIKVEGMLLSGLEFSFDDKVAIASITRDMLAASGASEDDLDDIAAIPCSIEGVSIGIIIRELSSTNKCKLSVRTNPPYSARQICEHFGGGGHDAAAGCIINKPIPEIKELLKELIENIMELK
ncbi:MAG: DHH family phosphoesterase [Oscillospiraceae bacterium]|nr:DHH family phosphoesterase [Oscillospiraceae bacterium]